MNHDRSKPQALEHEQALLAHFRAHSDGEPSAELDARIVAAASAAASATARESARQVSWRERLHHWLFAGSRQRWSVALAGLACVGIGLSLTWRTLEQTPAAFDGVPPVARTAAHDNQGLARQYAAPAAPAAAERKKEAPVLRMQSAPAATMADTVAEESAALAELVDKVEPRDGLLRLLALRRAGELKEAERLHGQLRADYPQLDIDAELARLEGETKR